MAGKHGGVPINLKYPLVPPTVKSWNKDYWISPVTSSLEISDRYIKKFSIHICMLHPTLVECYSSSHVASR